MRLLREHKEKAPCLSEAPAYSVVCVCRQLVSKYSAQPIPLPMLSRLMNAS